MRLTWEWSHGSSNSFVKCWKSVSLKALWAQEVSPVGRLEERKLTLGWIRADREEEVAGERGDKAGKSRVHKQRKFPKKLIVLVCSGLFSPCLFLFLWGHQFYLIRAPPLLHNLTLITTVKVLSSNIATWGIGLQDMNSVHNNLYQN